MFVSTDGLSTNQKGAIAEEAIATEATRLGIIVCRPNTDARYDLVFDLSTRLLRVQCKWAARRGEVVLVRGRGSYHSPRKGYVRSDYCADEIDAIAAYCEELQTTYLVPVSLVDGVSQIHLRLSAARNGQRAAIHYADDYDLGAIAQLEERRHGMAEVVGSSPTSSTPERAPEVVGAHEFRNHFGWFMERAAAGETFDVTRRGRPFARLSPPPSLLDGVRETITRRDDTI